MRFVYEAGSEDERGALRERFARLLEPQAALRLLRGLTDEASPDVILMDLAMPGIDGWETIRRLRAEGLSAAPVAIVSANAFDRRLDNDLGIGADDYVLKPVRGEELLDWLGRTLALEWRSEPPAASPAPVPARAADAALPALASLRALAEQVRVGYPRGIHRWLDHIDATEPACADFTRRLRALASRFQLDAMAADLAQALRARELPHG